MSNVSRRDTYLAFFEKSFDATFVLNERCIIENMNAAAEALSGCPRAELIGKPLTTILPDDIVPVHEGFVAAYLMQRGESSVLGQSRRFAIKNSDGEKVPVELKAFELGSLAEPVQFGAVMLDLRERVRLEAERDETLDRLEKLAMTDELTGLPNRRAFLAAFRREHAQTRRHNHPACFAYIDIDHFKRINDNFGHAAGDAVLQKTARLIADSLRTTDLVGRIGGEEFGALLSYDSVSEAVIAADRLRTQISCFAFDLGLSQQTKVTVSIGIAQLQHAASMEVVLEEADGAMYCAKMSGRDCVKVASRIKQVEAALPW